jgi:ATP-dependent DNA helicase RecQ
MAYPTTNIEAARAGLREHFGFDDFRQGQREVIEAILAGYDTIVVMPTGGGKSLCYQLPALLVEGATIVVSPLISLMKDQVDALSARHLPATFINSSLDFAEQKMRLAGVRAGLYKLIYVAPERFRSLHFVEALQSVQVSLFAVDEAHCISAWGHDFRPDYLRLRSVIETLGRPQTIALTATATPYVRSDIIEQLGLTDPRAFVSGFDRPNLSLNVVHTQKEREKIAHIKALAARFANNSGIIYTSTRKSVEAVAARLQTVGLHVTAYHAGMSDAARTRAQEDFMTGRTQMIVATNAFGMGIDKADVRFVAHYHLPGSIEAYYQEIGRAGRDGLPSTCTLLFNYADKRTQDYFIEGSYPSPEQIAQVYGALAGAKQKRIELSAKEIGARAGIRNEMAVYSSLVTLEKSGHIERGAGGVITMLDESPARHLRIRPGEIARRAALEQRKLREMISFCYTDKCYRAFLLNYFGDVHHPTTCGMCGNCTKQPGRDDRETESPISPPHEPSSTPLHNFVRKHTPFAHGLEQELTDQTRRRRLREAAEASGATEEEKDTNIAQEARALSADESLRVRKILACAARMQGRFGKGLLAATLRGSRAKNVLGFGLAQLSTYSILSDMTQDELLMYIDALIVAGCLDVTSGAYPTVQITNLGQEVMRERAQVELILHASEAQPEPPAAAKNVASDTPMARRKAADTVDATYKLYSQGLTIEEISRQRNLTEITVEKHLAECIAQGRLFDLSAHVATADRALIESAIQKLGAQTLRPLREALPAHITYRMIRFVIADLQGVKEVT